MEERSKSEGKTVEVNYSKVKYEMSKLETVAEVADVQISHL